MEWFDRQKVAEAIRYETSCAGGPGGQHVNRSRTRITACLALAECGVFDPDQLERVRRKLATRISQEDLLRVSAEGSRSQEENRQQALQVLLELIAGALKRPRKRIATKRSRASQERRVGEKKQRGQIKRGRRAGGRGGMED